MEFWHNLNDIIYSENSMDVMSSSEENNLRETKPKTEQGKSCGIL